MADHKNPQPSGAGPDAAGRDAPGSDAAAPKDLKVQIGAQRLMIVWHDGTQSEYALGELRRRCPCATCRTEREQQDPNPLKVLKSDPTDVRVTTAQLVGN